MSRVVVWLAVVAAIVLGHVAAAPAMEFRLAQPLDGRACKGRACPLVIVATGDINLNSAEDLIAFIGRNKNQPISNVVILHSPGGRLVGGIKLGLLFRVAGMSAFIGRVVQLQGRSTAVTGSCMSACVLAFMGARKRFVMPSGRIGIHRSSLPGANNVTPLGVLLQARTNSESEVALLRKYAQRMGVSPRIVDMAEKVSPTSIRILTPAEITQLRLATVTR